ncbi:MAG: hypothetical protein IV108_06390 [Burkholderiales bacterium]|nr:hypothetical protein [Burkholderiales bacterium]
MLNQITGPKAALSARHVSETLPPGWQRAILLMMVLGFMSPILFTIYIYLEAPPIPDKVTGPDGLVLFTGDDIRGGQQVFLKYGMLDNGTIWAPGAKRGTDILAGHQQTLALHSAMNIAQQRYGQPLDKVTPAQRASVEVEVFTERKRNRYDPKTGVLAVGPVYGDWYQNQTKVWKERLSNPVKKDGTRVRTIRDPAELKQLSAFVAWTEWAADANSPGVHSYANSLPADAMASNGRP